MDEEVVAAKVWVISLGRFAAEMIKNTAEKLQFLSGIIAVNPDEADWFSANQHTVLNHDFSDGKTDLVAMCNQIAPPTTPFDGQIILVDLSDPDLCELAYALAELRMKAGRLVVVMATGPSGKANTFRMKQSMGNLSFIAPTFEVLSPEKLVSLYQALFLPMFIDSLIGIDSEDIREMLQDYSLGNHVHGASNINLLDAFEHASNDDGHKRHNLESASGILVTMQMQEAANVKDALSTISENICGIADSDALCLFALLENPALETAFSVSIISG